jgi:hypothetical protein
MNVVRALVVRLGVKVVALVLPFVILGIAWVGVGVFRFFENRQNHLVVMNGTDRALEVTVGVETKPAKPYEYAVFFGVPSGQIEVKAPGFEAKKIAFGDRPSFTRGNRGIVRFGGPVNVALVKRVSETLDAPALDSVKILPPADGLLLIPLEATEYRPDQKFYPSRKIDDSIFDNRVRTCSFEPATRELGCGVCKGTWQTCSREDSRDLERIFAR